MKAKLRRITVDGAGFLWRVAPVIAASDFGHVDLKLWREGHKSPPWARVRCRFDNPWLHYGEILAGDPQRVAEVLQLRPLMPAQVADIIRSLRLRSADPLAGPLGEFDLDRAGGLSVRK